MAARRLGPRYPSKAVVARLAECVRELGLDVDKCAVEFRPDGGVRFMPGVNRQTGEVDSWGDL